MANARKTGMPGWVKWSLGGFGMLVLLAAVMIAWGHNPLEHFARHMDMSQ